MQNIIIIDDIEEHINRIKTCIETNFESFSISYFKYPNSTIDNIAFFPANTIFVLDLLLTGYNGIDIAKKIHSICKNAQIIFTSSYLTKAPDVYEVDHCYFVYKLDIEKKLPNAISKALANIREINENIFLSIRGKQISVNLDSIYYIERKERQSFIHTETDIIKIKFPIKKILEKLPSYFIQSHNSYIFNAKHIDVVEKSNIILKKGQNIPVSRAYKKNVENSLNDFFCIQL